MNITVNKSDLIGGLSIVSRAISSRSTLPALDGILLDIKNNELVLTGSDLNLTITTKISILKLDEEGSVLVNAKRFFEIIKKMPSDEISLRVKDNKLTIKSGKVKLDIVYMQSSDYPELKGITETEEFPIDDIQLKNLIKSTIFATAKDETRPILTGELLEIKENKLSLVALDGYRLALRTMDLIFNECAVVIPSKTLLELDKILENKEETVLTSITDNFITFSYGKTTINSKLLEGSFVNYNALLPKDFKTIVTIDRKSFLEMIDRSNVINNDHKMVKLNFSNNTIFSKSESEFGTIEDQIPCDINGDDLEIAFNSAYLIDMLKSIDTENVMLNFNNSVSPCKITSSEDLTFEQLVLPVRLMKK